MNKLTRKLTQKKKKGPEDTSDEFVFETAENLKPKSSRSLPPKAKFEDIYKFVQLNFLYFKIKEMLNGVTNGEHKHHSSKHKHKDKSHDKERRKETEEERRIRKEKEPFILQ